MIPNGTSLPFDVYRGPQRVLSGPNPRFLPPLGRQEDEFALSNTSAGYA
jgi:hypothetical protein